MLLFKVPLLILSAVSFNIALHASTSPTPEDKVMGTSFREWIWNHAAIPTATFLKTIMWMAALAESAVIVSSLRGFDLDIIGVAISSVVLTVLLGPAETSQLTDPFITGVLLVISGAIIRLQCYRTLGPFFTIQQLLRKDHRLITSRPYSVVRHPGYASLMMCIIGPCIMYGSPGSWLTTSLVWSVLWIKLAVGGWYFIMLASLVTLRLRRTAEEDCYLAEWFGKEWEAWVRQVKYKLVPFVY